MRLLDLPAEVVALIDAKKISMGHARALLGLEADAEREQFAQVIVERDLSVRQTEVLVRKGRRGEGGAAQKKTPELLVISEVLKTASVHVQLHQKSSGAARIVVDVVDAKARDAMAEAFTRAADEEEIETARLRDCERANSRGARLKNITHCGGRLMRDR